MVEKIYIYGLVDPRTGKVRYIGKSIIPEARRRQHVSEARNGTHTKLGVWIRELDALGLYPDVVVLEETTEDGWEEAERRWIAHYLATEDGILNVFAGGKDHRHVTEPRWVNRPGRAAKASALKPEELRAMRESLGMSQHEIARALGVHHSLISLYESGKRTIPHRIRLAVERLQNP